MSSTTTTSLTSSKMKGSDDTLDNNENRNYNNKPVISSSNFFLSFGSMLRLKERAKYKSAQRNLTRQSNLDLDPRSTTSSDLSRKNNRAESQYTLKQMNQAEGNSCLNFL